MKKTNSEPSPFSRADVVAAFLSGLLALALYVVTLAPTVTGEDSGELIGAAYGLGIPHPPGYPVWTMLAHVFTWLPLGNVAWRVNLCSAVCAAGTVSLLVLVGISVTRSRWAAVIGAMTFAVSRALWEQALIAEVYTLNTLFMAAMLLLCVRGVRAGERVSVFALALAAGTSTGVHNTLVLLLPFWAVFALVYLPPSLRLSPRFLAQAGGLFLLGLGVHVYLPLASRFDPGVDWGNPETLRGWWDVIRREQYAFMVDQYPRSAGRLAGQLWTMSQFWFRDLAGLGALLGIWGGVLLFKRDRLLACFLGCMAVATVAAITWMQNFEQSREWLWVMRVFLLPAELITCVGIMAAVAWGGERRPRLRPFVVGLALASLAGSMLLHGGQSKRGYTYAEDYGRHILASLPENAIYVAGPDHQAFPVLYLQVVEGLRPDVTLLRRYGYLDLKGIPGLAEANPDLLPYPKLRFEPEILGWILKHTERPLVFSKETAIAGIDVRFEPIGLLVQALRPGEAARPVQALEGLTWRNPLPAEAVDEYSMSLIQYDVALAEARAAFSRGDQAAAIARVADAVVYGHGELDVLNNAGVICGRYGALEVAADYFRAILAEDPGHVAAARNLARAERRIEASGGAN